jgi:DNA helicase-2/ATP-dependent DNA helicase PcrA
MTRAMNTLILSRAHYRRRYGNDAPEMSIPSRFIEEVPSQLVENLSGSAPGSAWSSGGASRNYGRRGGGSDFAEKHFNYEDESQEYQSPAVSKGFGAKPKYNSDKPFVASWMTPKKPAEASPKGKGAETPVGGSMEQPNSIDNIARFFGGKTGHGQPGALPQPVADQPEPVRVAHLKKGQRVRHSKYGEGTILMREGDGEEAKLTVLFSRVGMKKLIEKFANLQKI